MAEPKVRFKRDDGSNYPAWTQVALGDIATRVTRRNANNETDRPLTIASIEGLVDQRTYFGKTIASKDMSGYILLKNGEYAYNKSYSVGYDYGSIKRLDHYDMGALSTLYICFALNTDQNSDFYNCYFNSLSWYNQMAEICAEGARNHGLLNVSPADFFKIKLSVPSSRGEQQKIADFLSFIDGVIAASNEEVANLEIQKKAAMKKIFSQEVRFKRKDGSDYPEWEEGSFGNLIEIYEKRVDSDCNLPILTSSKQFGIQYQNDHFSKDQQHDITGYGVLPRGYCTYRNRSDGTDFTFNINNLCDIGIVSKFYPVFKATERCVLYFLMVLLNNEPTTVKKISITAKGTGQKVLSFLDLQKINVPIPCLEEQRLISDFLSGFDEAIAAAKKELELWKKLKKGLLQQMFV